MKVLEAPLDKISRAARPYPAYLLHEGDTGLALFAAGFLGHNDVIHMARAEMHVTCVDTDQARLGHMSRLYPDDWVFVNADAWEFADQAFDRGEQWDVVSADTWTGEGSARSIATLEVWCAIARHTVTATIATGQRYVIPDGWGASVFERSARASWLVLRR